MVEIDEKRRVWEAIYDREQVRRRNMDELRKIVDEMGESKKTAKTMLKLVVYTGGIKATEATDIIGVKRATINRWLRVLLAKEFVEVESPNHPNPTIKPTKDIIKKFRAYQKRVVKQDMKRFDEDISDLGEKTQDLGNDAQPSVEDERPTPQKESPKVEDDVDVELNEGVTYLVYEHKSEKSLKLFAKEVRKDTNGFFITRSNPDLIRKKHYLADSKIVWLTNVQTNKDLDSVSGPQELSIKVSKFIDENEKTIILLEGLEYLISNNNFQVVLRLIQQLRDKVSTSDSKMLIPLNPDSLEDRQLSLLEGECQIIRLVE